MTQLRTQTILILTLLAWASSVLAGNLDAPAAPTDAGSAMFTIEDLYNRLNIGTTGTKRSGAFTEPAGAPGSTMHSLNEVMDKAPAQDDVNGASPDQVAAGKKFWGLKSGLGWGMMTGTMQNAVMASNSNEIKGGFIATTTLSTVDTDLSPGNVRAGVTIFGVTGNPEIVDTSTGNATAGEILLDRQAWVAGMIATGRRAGGVVLPNTGFFWMGQKRWFKSGDGTVVDCLTGLVWLSNVPHVDRPYLATTGAQIDCMRWLYSIRHGMYGLTDNSEPGDWDMPTLKELMSLFIPSPAGQEIGSFTGSQAFDNPWISEYYWTSTPVPTGVGVGSVDTVYVINMRDGSYIAENKMARETVTHFVWPVRRKVPKFP